VRFFRYFYIVAWVTGRTLNLWKPHSSILIVFGVWGQDLIWSNSVKQKVIDVIKKWQMISFLVYTWRGALATHFEIYWIYHLCFTLLRLRYRITMKLRSRRKKGWRLKKLMRQMVSRLDSKVSTLRLWLHWCLASLYQERQHCILLIYSPSPIWPIMCLVGR